MNRLTRLLLIGTISYTSMISFMPTPAEHHIDHAEHVHQHTHRWKRRKHRYYHHGKKHKIVD